MLNADLACGFREERVMPLDVVCFCRLVLSWLGMTRGSYFSFLFDVSGGIITKAKRLESISDRYGVVGVVNCNCMLHLS